MTRALPFRPKRRRLFMCTALIAVWSLIVALVVTRWRGWSAGDVWGLTFGSIAAALMFLGALYPMRRRLVIPPLRTAQDWLQFHIYGTTLAGLFVLVHMGFRGQTGRSGGGCSDSRCGRRSPA
jgi:hypothetical protein